MRHTRTHECNYVKVIFLKKNPFRRKGAKQRFCPNSLQHLACAHAHETRTRAHVYAIATHTARLPQLSQTIIIKTNKIIVQIQKLY